MSLKALALVTHFTAHFVNRAGSFTIGSNTSQSGLLSTAGLLCRNEGEQTKRISD